MRAYFGALLLASLAQPALGQVSPPAPDENLLKRPMIFFLAKGGPDACGPGCSEWIAAEGEFDPGAPARLRALLARTRTKLPIYFASPGGIADSAFAIGRLMRARGMTAGVGRTMPDGCKDVDAKTCSKLVRSGQAVPSELLSLASCNSACVYAVVGAKVRQVPPGVRLGVHAGKLVRVSPDGRVFASTREATKGQTLAGEQQIRKYLGEMGIDLRVMEVISKTPHEKVYYLSREEIAGFGIDTREFLETNWTLFSSRPDRGIVAKFLTEAKGEERKEFRTSAVYFTCVGTRRFLMMYSRGVAPREVGQKNRIVVSLGEGRFDLPQKSAVERSNFLSTGHPFETNFGIVPGNGLNTAALADSIIITVIASASGDAPTPPRIVKLATAGLSEALEQLSKRCEAPKPPDEVSSGAKR